MECIIYRGFLQKTPPLDKLFVVRCKTTHCVPCRVQHCLRMNVSLQVDILFRGIKSFSGVMVLTTSALFIVARDGHRVHTYRPLQVNQRHCACHSHVCVHVACIHVACVHVACVAPSGAQGALCSHRGTLKLGSVC